MITQPDPRPQDPLCFKASQLTQAERQKLHQLSKEVGGPRLAVEFLLKYQFLLWLQEKKTVLVCLSINENHVIYHSRDEALEGDEANTALTSKKLMISAQGVTDAWVGMCPLWHEPDSRSLLTFCTLGTLLASPYWVDSYFIYTLKTSRWYICNLHSFSFSFSQRKLD